MESSYLAMCRQLQMLSVSVPAAMMGSQSYGLSYLSLFKSKQGPCLCLGQPVVPLAALPLDVPNRYATGGPHRATWFGPRATVSVSLQNGGNNDI